ncbi:MAG: peptidoglycan recognition protein family protein [Scytolyngbya sp. HA4215-MV1]|jgi:hypothetical protein|nr:peptidoglycan recognition protein family protein [Scytolyngbya sp. HA4215-MV1]
MKKKLLNAIALFSLCVATVIISIHSSQAEMLEGVRIGPANANQSAVVTPANATDAPAAPTPAYACALQPPNPPPKKPTPPANVNPGKISLSRFRQVTRVAATPEETATNPAEKTELSQGTPIVRRSPAVVLPSYSPKEEIALAHYTNYGERFARDLYGKPAKNDPIIVLHETVATAQSAVNLFQTPHFWDDSSQVSYHALIRRNGAVIYVVPPDKRAFGAGNSIFKGSQGDETVKTNPDFPPSVNNFAYHISLETPSDGFNNAYRHSGYTAAQYQSLAWLAARTGVPESRITTHKAVDRSGSRMDPRSFDYKRFFGLLKAYPRQTEIVIGCADPSAV